MIPSREEIAAIEARWAEGEAMLAAANAASTGPGAVVEETTTLAEMEARWQDERALHRSTRDAAMKDATEARALLAAADGAARAGDPAGVLEAVGAARAVLARLAGA